MAQIADAVAETRDGVILSLEVTPGAREDLFPHHFNPWRRTIGCRVAAPALGGRANAAVIALVAGVLGLPQNAVSIRSGATSPVKKLHIAGKKKADLVAELTRILE